jgi:hypothetical protein
MGEMEWTFILTGLFVLFVGVGAGLLVSWIWEKGKDDNDGGTGKRN